MKKREDLKMLITVVVSGVTTLGLGSLSALYLDRLLGPLFRGTDWDFLLFPGVVILIGGYGYVWYIIAKAVMGFLDRHL